MNASVVVATDFSPAATTAVDWAVEISRRHELELVLVHALHLHGPITDFLPSPTDVEESLQRAALARLDHEVERIADRGIAIRPRLLVGIPSEAILSAAAEEGAKVLVMGHRGLGSWTERLLGSTTARVVRTAARPVLTVHAEDQRATDPIRTIVVPTDFSPDAELAAKTAKRLLPRLGPGVRIVLVHAIHLPIEYTAYGTVPTAIHFPEDAFSTAADRLQEVADRLGDESTQVEAQVAEGYPPDVIVTTAEQVGADLIVMGSHGRSGLRHLLVGSNAERVLGTAPCPVLTVRSGSE